MNSRESILALAIVATIGLGVAFQGWRARGPDVDVIASMVRAVALVERGHIPQRGNLTDLHAFRPPGHIWLMVPGASVLSDPRLVEIAATGLLYPLTLWGVFVLARRIYGSVIALWAVLFYAFSSIAINFAAVLQPKAYPVFTVWMVYGIVRWVSGRDARWLAASLLIFAFGTYVHIEMLPFALIYPVVWWRYRAPLRPAPIATALLLALVMWSPYLHFQIERGFIDMESQLLMQPLFPRAEIIDPYCGEVPSPARLTTIGAVMGEWRDRPAAAWELLMMNFETRVPGGPVVLLALVAAGTLMAWRARTGEAAVVAMAFAVPAAVLVLLTEPGVPRTIGVWPFEVVLIASCLGRALDAIRAHRLVRLAAVAAVSVICAINLQTLSRFRDAPVHGWSGVEPAQVEWAAFRSVRCEDER